MDDWTANMIMCVVACYLCLGRLPKGTQKQQQSTRAKKRDFSIWWSCVGTPKEHSYLIKGSPSKVMSPKRKIRPKTKQHKNTSIARDMMKRVLSISQTTPSSSEGQRRIRRTSSTRASTSCSFKALKKTTTTIKGQQQNTSSFASSASSGRRPPEKHERKHTVETRRRDDAKKKVVVRATPPPSSSSGGGHPAETLLDESRGLYEQGERMQGYKKLEQAMKLDDDASLPVRREIRYQAMCCVAAFGDVEMAKQYLREMELLGLPYDVAINDPSLMRMESSALMRNQLKKFASGSEKSFGTVQREVYERTKKTLPGGPGGDAPIVNKGLMELEIDDNTDASVGGIAKRVGGVVLASIGGFALLFFAGLKLIQESGY